MRPDRTTIDLGWGPVSYLAWQPDAAGSGPPVVLLHGGGVDNASLSWDGLGAALAAAGHRVYAPDHPHRVVPAVLEFLRRVPGR